VEEVVFAQQPIIASITGTLFEALAIMQTLEKRVEGRVEVAGQSILDYFSN
jgi:hypothetical protein